MSAYIGITAIVATVNAVSGIASAPVVVVLPRRHFRDTDERNAAAGARRAVVARAPRDAVVARAFPVPARAAPTVAARDDARATRSIALDSAAQLAAPHRERSTERSSVDARGGDDGGGDATVVDAVVEAMSRAFVDVDKSAVTPVEKACAEDAKPFDDAVERRGDEATTSARRCASPLDAFVARDVLTATECERLVDAARRSGRLSFWHEDAEARNRKSFRNADTVEVMSKTIAEALWARLKPHVTPEITIEEDETHGAGARGRWVARGVNEHLLFNRYSGRGHFSPHTDGATIEDFNTRSFYSVLVYLNDCARGGETSMFAPPSDFEPSKFVRDEDDRYRWPDEWIADAAPCARGTALVFRQDIPHEGAPVGEGAVKFIIRTDVMYAREPPAFADAVGAEAYALHKRAVDAETSGDAMEAMRLFRHCRRLCPAYADFVGI